MIGGGDLGVDIRQCSNLLDVSQAGTNPAVADVELDALVEQHRVLKNQQSAWSASLSMVTCGTTPMLLLSEVWLTVFMFWPPITTSPPSGS